MTDTTTSASDDDSGIVVMKTLLFAHHLHQAGRTDEAQACVQSARTYLSDGETRFSSAELASGYGLLVRSAAQMENWAQACEAGEKYLKHRWDAPLGDREHLSVLNSLATAYFQRNQIEKLEPLAVDLVARTRVVDGVDSDAYRTAMDNLVNVRERKSFAEGPRRPTRNTVAGDDSTVSIKEMPNPLHDLLADYHQMKTHEVSGSQARAPRKRSRLSRRGEATFYFVLSLAFVYAIAILGDFVISAVLAHVRLYLTLINTNWWLVYWGMIFATFYPAFYATSNLANLQTPFVAKVEHDPDAMTCRIHALRLDRTAWYAGLVPAIIAIAVVITNSPHSLHGFLFGVASGWLFWPVVHYGTTGQSLKDQLEAHDFMLFLRRFGGAALFRFRGGQRGVIAVFDQSRRDYWAPTHLARMFVNWRGYDYVQIALPDETWYPVVWSLANSTTAVSYDLEGYVDRAPATVSGLMMETELFLFLDKPIAFLARRRDGTIPRWLPTPLLVQTEGRQSREIKWQIGNIVLNRLDSGTTRRLELHRAKIHAELDYVRELRARQREQPHGFGFNPIGALLATDQWSPQTAWDDQDSSTSRIV